MGKLSLSERGFRNSKAASRTIVVNDLVSGWVNSQVPRLNITENPFEKVIERVFRQQGRHEVRLDSGLSFASLGHIRRSL